MLADPSLRIRARLVADDEFIYELASTAFSEYTKDAGRHTYAAATRALTLVAERDVRPVGFAVVEIPDEGIAYLSALAVVEQERGRGVGRALLRATERVAAARGARRMQLVTAASNLAALALFLHAGFRRSPRRPRLYPRGQPALILDKTLRIRKAP